MSGVILSCRQIDQVKLQCKINLKKLLPDKNERKRFEKKWNDFLESDPCNNEIFELKGDSLIYQSERLIPTELDNT
jgi:formiminotetrahydrofolate cyclodeaminase